MCKLIYLLLLVWCCSQCRCQDPFLCIVPTRYGPALAGCPFKGHSGNCTEMMSCGFIYPKSYSKTYECYSDLDCPEKMKCCSHPCYHHYVCVISTIANTTTSN